MANLYDVRRYGKIAFLITTAAVVATFLYISTRLIADLSVAERERMEIWAGATREIAASSLSDEDNNTNIDFLLGIISSNTNIPVMLTDSAGNILDYRNFALPVPTAGAEDERNAEFLADKYRRLSESPNKIDIEIAEGLKQYLYYEDSTLLKRMSVFPYIQLLVMLAFIAVVYFAVLSTKKAEQNKVWVGLSKETAHQLGTPISSLMAWMELLPDMGVDADTLAEINKDVNRLSTIASRFSKIGSEPKMEDTDLDEIVNQATSYMKTRISPRIDLTYTSTGEKVEAKACAPLMEWVIENLIKNAVDAIDAESKNARISVSVANDANMAIIEVTDTGKGISRSNFSNVFNPGFTTKSRGWGLGLTLAKRIVEEYHRGKIFVARSMPGVGTTFRIEIPKTSPRIAG